MKKIASFLIVLLLVTTVYAQDKGHLTVRGDTLSTDIIIYPNPTPDVVFIEHNCPVTEVSVFNLLGLVLGKFETTHNQNYILDLSELRNGMYFIRIADKENNIYIQKLIKE
jgi:hypothetical protein